MSGANIKHRWLVGVAWLGLCACGRLGFQEQALAPAPDASGDTAADGCTTIGSDNYCTALPHLDHEPVIDGQRECGLSLRPFTPQGWVGIPSAPRIPSDQGTPRLAMAWHEQGVYVYVEISDGAVMPPAAADDIWCGDAAEVYLDSDGMFASTTIYDKPGAAQFIAPAPTGDADDAARAKRYRDGNLSSAQPWSTPNHKTFLTDTGYGLEAFITAPDLDLSTWSLHAGDKVGVDVSANVSLTQAAVDARQEGDCGTRAGQYFLRTATQSCIEKACTPYRNTSAFCTPTLR